MMRISGILRARGGEGRWTEVRRGMIFRWRRREVKGMWRSVLSVDATVGSPCYVISGYLTRVSASG
jgi:hypothetical protein